MTDVRENVWFVRVQAWYERIICAGVLPTDDEAAAARKRLVAGIALISPFNLVALGVVYLAYGEEVAGGFYVGFGCWIWLDLLVYNLVHRNLTIAFWVSAPVALLAHLFTILSLGDLIHSSGLLLWGLAFPVATGVVFVSARQMIPLYLLYGVNVVVTSVVGGDRSSLPPAAERVILLWNLLTLSAFAVIVLVAFVAQRDRAYALLDEERRRARELLLSILPEEIADELSRSPHVIADQFDDVSVLFCDVVGFTPMSAQLTPAELVLMLDEMFGRFDELVERAGLEKIKTIGDCYMVAAGVPRPRPDHAVALVQLALDMLAAAHDFRFQGRQVQLRVGINSGSVVAGVIGRRKFSYDLWGDVVNTASRMESHGVPGAVQVTDSTRQLVADEFDCTARGTIDVRGKGNLSVWLVADRRVVEAGAGVG